MKSASAPLLFVTWLLTMCIWNTAWSQAEAPGSEVKSQLEGRFSQERSASHLTDTPSDDDAADSLTNDVAAFYRARGFRPVWQDQTQVSALVEALRELENDGLSPEDYRPQSLATQWARLTQDASSNARALADAEVAATSRLLLALRHLSRGKVDPASVDEDWEIGVDEFAPDYAALGQQVERGEIATAFDAARPEYPPYQRLRDGLARYRAIAEAGGWPHLPERESPLKPGDRHPDVALLRERLSVLGKPELLAADIDYYALEPLQLEAPDAEHYDATLAEAVRQFQRRHLLEDDGVIGPKTRAALNVPAASRVAQIRVNLERARWLLHDLPEQFVLVDIAGYQLSYYRGPEDVWRTRIVVGQPYRSTPTLRSEITHLNLNPTWTIPPTIYRDDMLPKIRNDLAYLEQENLKVIDYQGNSLDPRDIDWQKPGNIMLRKPAGGDNPLGRVVIRFPNDYSVYLHDTPAQHLFNRPQRAASSGCIRVENVMEFVRLLLEDNPRWNVAALSKAVGSNESRTIRLEEPVPVIIHYWTVDTTRQGQLAFRPDIYERDDKLQRALDEPLDDALRLALE